MKIKMTKLNAHKVGSSNQLSWFPEFSHLKLHVKVQIDIPGNVDAANAGTNVLSCFGDGQSHERDHHKIVLGAGRSRERNCSEPMAS